jgi:hypothetical protein
MEANKEIRIGVRFSAEELALVRMAIKGTGVKLSTYIRAAVLKDIQASLPSDPMAQLKAREQQQKVAEEFAAMMIKAFKEAEKGKKGK